jgi:hypothetical protein
MPCRRAARAWRSRASRSAVRRRRTDRLHRLVPDAVRNGRGQPRGDARDARGPAGPGGRDGRRSRRCAGGRESRRVRDRRLRGAATPRIPSPTAARRSAPSRSGTWRRCRSPSGRGCVRDVMAPLEDFVRVPPARCSRRRRLSCRAQRAARSSPGTAGSRAGSASATSRACSSCCASRAIVTSRRPSARSARRRPVDKGVPPDPRRSASTGPDLLDAGGDPGARRYVHHRIDRPVAPSVPTGIIDGGGSAASDPRHVTEHAAPATGAHPRSQWIACRG